MNWINTILVLLAALLAVFWEAAFPGLRHLLGAQIDLLPALMVYASLYAGIATVALLAVCGGLWFDSLSANPFGVSVLPLLFCGILIYAARELLLREETFAQVVLGMAASLATPLMVLVMLLSAGHRPLAGWGTIWQLIVMTAAGAVASPVFCACFGYLNQLLGYAEVTTTSFRPDREIRRGR
ncbi:MAG TPA: hypothetical protein VHH88_04930 [Verrucomicrobiae bacterium]|nr:hypothetical protein [Verrucomicrobiae bacterium]